jgi:uncharacterized protein YndB with AHSA1/START domain
MVVLRITHTEETKMLEVTHTEFSNSTPETVWSLWSNIETWPVWDTALEWCRHEKDSSFEVGGKALLMPKGAFEPVSMVITECTAPRSFTDDAKTGLGLIRLSHTLELKGDGVMITHTMQIFPCHAAAQAILETQLFPKMQKALPQSVKTLAALAEKACTKVCK